MHCALHTSLRVEDVLSSVDAVVITGSKAAGFSASLFPDVVKRAKAAGKVPLHEWVACVHVCIDGCRCTTVVNCSALVVL